MKKPMVIPHSGGLKQLKHNGTRTSMASPQTASVIPHSGTKMGMPSQSNMNIGQPYAKASDRSEQKFTSQPQIIPHSPVDVPRNPKRFNRKKMSAGVATQMPND